MAVGAFFAPTYSFNSVLTAVFRRVLESEPVEQTYKEHALLSMLEKEDGSRYQVNGGLNLQVPIASLGSTRAVPVKKGSTIPLTDSDDVTMLQYLMAHYSIGIVMWGTELAEAKGKDKLYDLAKRKKDAALMEMADKLDTDLWASAAVTNGLSGIRLAFPTDPTAATNYGGINGSTNTFWRSKTITTGGVASSVLVGQLDQMDQNLRSEKSKSWSFIVTTYNLERIYKQVGRTYMSLNAPMNASAKKAVDLGVGNGSNYNGKPVVPDNSCPAGFLYHVSSESTKWAYDPDFNYTTDDFVDMTPGEQYGKASLMHCRGALVCNERRTNGQTSGLTES